MDFTHVRWRKSSRSFNGADCIEVGVWRKGGHSTTNGARVELAADVQMVAVRDSKDPEGAKLAFSRREWAAFTGRIRGDLRSSR